MKCAICSGNIGETFLKKPLGTWVKDAKGRKNIVCNICQAKFRSKEELLKQI